MNLDAPIATGRCWSLLLVALAAATGSVEMLRISWQRLAAQRKSSVLRCRLSDEGVDDFEDVLLLAARQLGDGFKRLADFAAGRHGAATSCF